MSKAIEKIIKIARGELGKTELPAGSNNTAYGQEYGLQGQPWCVIFLWWLFKVTGLSKLFYGGQKTASCGALLRWAQREGLTVPVSEIQAGDIPLMNFSGTKEPEHCGLVVERLTAGSFQTIEGNTSPGMEGSQDNGGCVALKTRYPSQVVAVIRPRYETMGYVGHWAEDNIRWGIDKGLLNGYEDGSFRPDKPITRAEVATILHRYDDYRFGGSGR